MTEERLQRARPRARKTPEAVRPETLASLAESQAASDQGIEAAIDLGEPAATSEGIEVVTEPQEPPQVRVTRAAEPVPPPSFPTREPSPAPEPAVEADDRLVLPRGAWIAMRKSGGLLFSSREIAIYPNGQVTTSAIGGGRAEHREELPRLSKADLAALRRTVRRIDFRRLPIVAARQRSDALAYELVIASNRATYEIEATTGTIPKPLAPLIDHLNRILATGEGE